MVHKSHFPGQMDWDCSGTVWNSIKLLGTNITLSDPEFLLKVCLRWCVCFSVVRYGVMVWCLWWVSWGHVVLESILLCCLYGAVMSTSSLTSWFITSFVILLYQVAVYTRQELNIRVTANFLLALAAHLPNSKPHLRRYFCSAVQLPSDWLEVTRIYSTVCWVFFIGTYTLLLEDFCFFLTAVSQSEWTFLQILLGAV